MAGTLDNRLDLGTGRLQRILIVIQGRHLIYPPHTSPPHSNRKSTHATTSIFRHRSSSEAPGSRDSRDCSHLQELKRKKATGIDNLPSNLLKDAAPVISKRLAHIINLSLTTSIFPTEWKEAKITPLFKSGKKSSVENYRPISLLPVISKIAEKIV